MNFDHQLTHRCNIQKWEANKQRGLVLQEKAEEVDAYILRRRIVHLYFCIYSQSKTGVAPAFAQ